MNPANSNINIRHLKELSLYKGEQYIDAYNTIPKQ